VNPSLQRSFDPFEPLIDLAKREGQIGVIAYSPMASGLLTGAMSAERVAQFPCDGRQ
jgi:aryl-alcohol dehydrogenase-like predicted oxidoreductase